MIGFGLEGKHALVVGGGSGIGRATALLLGEAGVMSLARSMTNEWSPYGIRINCVAPDCIATPRVVASFEQQGLELAAGSEVPLGRWGQPEDIAGPLVFLLSDLSAFMSGQTLVVDGGSQAHFPHSAPMANK